MQNRIFEYKAQDSTVTLNQWFLSLIPAGLYFGFDAVLAGAPNMSLVLTHTQSGYSYTDIAQVVQSNNGLLRTPQGVVVIESADITVPLTPNNSILPRYDLIYCEHKYITTPGGQSAICKAVIGTPGGGRPSLPNPAIQIAIGYVYLPANTTTLGAAGVLFEKEPQPIFGQNGNYVTLTGTQYIEGLKKLRALGSNDTATVTVSGNTLQLPAIFNSFLFVPFSSTTFSDITDLSYDIGEDNVILLFTDQKLRLKHYSNGGQFLGHFGDIHLATGELVLLMRAKPSMAQGQGAPKYLAYKIDSSIADKVTKAFKMLIGNNAGTVVNDVSGSVALNDRGNYLTVDMTAATTIKHFRSMDAFRFSDTYAGGGVMYIRLVGGSGPYLLEHNNATPPVNYKSIITPTNLPMSLESGAILMMVEDVSAYRILNVISYAANTVSLAGYVAQLPLNLSVPVAGDILEFDGSAWVNVSGDIWADDKIENRPHKLNKLLAFKDQIAALNVGAGTIIVSPGGNKITVAYAGAFVCNDIVTDGTFSFDYGTILEVLVAGGGSVTLNAGSGRFDWPWIMTHDRHLKFDTGYTVFIEFNIFGSWTVVNAYETIWGELEKKSNIAQGSLLTAGITYQAGWSGPVYYRLNSVSEIYVQILYLEWGGGAAIGPLGGPVHVLTLPAGYRPGLTVYFIAFNENNSESYKGAIDTNGKLYIDPNIGTITAPEHLIIPPMVMAQ